MTNFEYYTPTRVVFGKDSEKKTGEVLKDQGEYSGNHVQEDMEYV